MSRINFYPNITTDISKTKTLDLIDAIDVELQEALNSLCDADEQTYFTDAKRFLEELRLREIANGGGKAFTG